MTQEGRTEIIAKLFADTDAAIKEANASLSRGEIAKAEAFILNAKANAAEYNRNICLRFYDKSASAENPMLVAINKYSLPAIGVKEERDGTRVLGYILDGEKIQQIDLLDMSRYLRINTDWKYETERLNLVLCLRLATEIGISAKRAKEISDTFSMSEIAKKLDLGETPTSNTQIVKRVQSIVDSIIGNSTHGYKVNNHDLAYISACYSKKGKKALTVRSANAGLLRTLVYDIAHRVVSGKVYDMEFKMKKTSAHPVVVKAETPVVAIPEVSNTPKAKKASAKKTAKAQPSVAVA